MTGYFPSKAELNTAPRSVQENVLQFAPGGLAAHSDGLDYDELLNRLEQEFQSAYAAEGDTAAVRQLHGVFHRNLSMANLSPEIYRRFAGNPTSMSNWLPPLVRATAAAGSPFAIPATKILRLSIELASFLRLGYTDASTRSGETFNRIISDAFDLVSTQTVEAGKHPGYFIKTGTFSSKFEFANTHCREPDEAGDYFRAIDDFAQMAGAGATVDLVVREWIEAADPENTPTIYHGMPLRTEFRAFLDLGGGPTDETDIGLPAEPLLGITPYWHPLVMERALEKAASTPGMEHVAGDYQTYLDHQPRMSDEFDRLLPGVETGLRQLIPQMRQAGMRGAFSIDVMANTDAHGATVLHLIDLATMHTSALTELLSLTEKYAFAAPGRIAELAGFLSTHDETCTPLVEPPVGYAKESLTTAYLYDSISDTTTTVDLYGTGRLDGESVARDSKNAMSPRYESRTLSES